MNISFFRGDDHQEKFRFKTFAGNVEELYFTVKCKNKYPRIKKKIGNGIELIEGWYYITFLPSDTDNLSCDLEMEYDIEIVTGGKKYTVQKGTFTLEEDITTPDCEV
jgi:hypothetical protein